MFPIFQEEFYFSNLHQQPTKTIKGLTKFHKWHSDFPKFSFLFLSLIQDFLKGELPSEYCLI